MPMTPVGAELLELLCTGVVAPTDKEMAPRACKLCCSTGSRDGRPVWSRVPNQGRMLCYSVNDALLV